jgi:choline dehydrogenase
VYGVLVCNINPASIGNITFNNTICIDPNYNSNIEDQNNIMIGIQKASEILSNNRFYNNNITSEILPGLFNNKMLLKSYIKLFTSGYYHYCGTCPMSTNNNNNNNNVFDDLKVKNINNLRISDASVIPYIPTCPISMTCMAIGLKCGELILNKQK